MADFKQSLQSAQRWLHRAENEWDQEHGIRAKLHLMLAEAELKRLNAVSKRSSHNWLRGVAAVCTLLIIGGYGWWMLAPGAKASQDAMRVAPIPAAVVVKQVLPEPAVVVPIRSPEPAEGHANSVAVEPLAASPVAVKQAEIPIVEKSTVTDVVSTEEMQKLVRTAGKTLRTQDKNTKQ